MSLTSIISHYRGDYEKRYRDTISVAQHHALNVTLQCRSGRFGKMHLDCFECEIHNEQPHSCGHRFCHRCQHHDTKQWVDRQQRKLLPVDYFLVTFTLPRQLRSLAFKQQQTVYSLLFDCASSTLKTFMSNDEALGAQAGMTAVLHTHSRRLDYHPHVHVVIPSGGINHKQNCWIQKNQNYLFRQKTLACVFRARLLRGLREAGFSLPCDLPEKWIVDCRHTGRGLPAIKYLSRYLQLGTACTVGNIALLDLYLRVCIGDKLADVGKITLLSVSLMPQTHGLTEPFKTCIYFGCGQLFYCVTPRILQ